MKKVLFLGSLVLVAALTGCGSSSSSGGNSVTVNVTPNASPVSVGVTLTQQFTATVSGTSNQAVTWSIAGSNCTGTVCGSISPTGLYTAPAAVPTPATVSIVATSQAFPAKSRTVNVRVVDIMVTVLPTTATVALNGQQQFTGSANPTSPINWTISTTGCAPNCGTISSSGLYTAPSILPSPGQVTVTATSAVDANATPVNAVVTLVPTSNSRLKGTYAFRFSGFDGGGAVYSAGVFTADGIGGIGAGIEDVNRSSGVQNLAFTGIYTVGSDGRGTMTLTTTGGAASMYDLAVGSSGETTFIEADATGTRGEGIIDKATSSAFSNSAIAGPFVMGLSGSDQLGARVGAAGSFATDGASPGNVTRGAIDLNDAGTHFSGSSIMGTYSVAPNGRGTLQVTVAGGGPTYNFSFYVVTAGELFIVSTDYPPTATNPRVGGLVLSQAIQVYDNTTFNGNSVFNLTGAASSSASVAAAGILATDGAGNVTSSSIFDENNAGTLVSQQSLIGTYTVSSAGTGTISFTSSSSPASSFALYAVTNNKAFLVDTSSTNALAGIVEPQVVGPSGSFSAATIQGSFVTTTAATASAAAVNISGVLSLDGSANITGMQDQSSQSGNTTGQPFTATYTVTANGRGTMSVTAPSSVSRVLYVINGSKFVTIDADSGNANPTVIESER